MTHHQNGRHLPRVNAVSEGAKLWRSCLQLRFRAKDRFGVIFDLPGLSAHVGLASDRCRLVAATTEVKGQKLQSCPFQMHFGLEYLLWRQGARHETFAPRFSAPGRAAGSPAPKRKLNDANLY